MPGDPASLAAALEHVLREPAAAEARAERGRRLVEQHYTAARAGREMVSLFGAGERAERAN
jgi:hypothetical protein